MNGSSYEGFLNSGVIEERVLSKEWTLNDVLNMDKSVDLVVQDLIDEMDVETKYLIVKDIDYSAMSNEIITVGHIVSIVLREELTNMVSFIVNKYLKEAKVKFNDNNNRVDMVKEIVLEDKNVVEEDEEELSVNVESPNRDKIITLKERIRNDTKQLGEKEKKELGMI